jgi:hypothetical protein
LFLFTEPYFLSAWDKNIYLFEQNTDIIHPMNEINRGIIMRRGNTTFNFFNHAFTLSTKRSSEIDASQTRSNLDPFERRDYPLTKQQNTPAPHRPKPLLRPKAHTIKNDLNPFERRDDPFFHQQNAPSPYSSKETPTPLWMELRHKIEQYISHSSPNKTVTSTEEKHQEVAERVININGIAQRNIHNALKSQVDANQLRAQTQQLNKATNQFSQTSAKPSCGASLLQLLLGFIQTIAQALSCIIPYKMQPAQTAPTFS